MRNPFVALFNNMIMNHRKKKDIEWVHQMAKEAEEQYKINIDNVQSFFDNIQMAEDKWNADVDILTHCVRYESAINTITKIYYCTRCDHIIDNVIKILKYQADRFSEVDNIVISQMTNVCHLIILRAYYDALAVQDLLLTNNVNRSALKKASDILCHAIQSDVEASSMYNGKTPLSLGIIEIIAPNFLRMMLLAEYNEIITKYDEICKYDLMKPETEISIILIKFCYMLAKIKLGQHDEGMPHGANLMMLLLKIHWLKAEANDSYWGYQFYILLLCELTLEETMNTYNGNALSLFDKLHPDYIAKENSNY